MDLNLLIKLTLSVLQSLFPNPSLTRVNIVRIACHVHEVYLIKEAIIWLHDQGFRVGVNIMQISEIPYDELSNACNFLSDLPIEVLYIADSLGSLRPKDVRSIFQIMAKSWNKSLGIHAHNNMGLALQNTIDAIDCGVTWVDTTVTGMGRVLVMPKLKNS